MTTTIEFDVQMSCKSCADIIDNRLKELDDVKIVDISVDKGCVVVETTLPSSLIQETIESTGRRAVLKGYAGTPGSGAAAVAMLGGMVGYSCGSVMGIVRFIQVDHSMCIIDGTIDGLSPGLHGLHIHESGDISQGCFSVGDHFNLTNSNHGGPSDPVNSRHTGDLGNIEAGNDGRAVFRLKDNLVKVSDVIGRSIVVTERADDLGRGHTPSSLVNGNSGSRLACGIISRSAGLFENSKKICACDGVTLWDERDKPLAGPTRRACL